MLLVFFAWPPTNCQATQSFVLFPSWVVCPKWMFSSLPLPVHGIGQVGRASALMRSTKVEPKTATYNSAPRLLSRPRVQTAPRWGALLGSPGRLKQVGCETWFSAFGGFPPDLTNTECHFCHGWLAGFHPIGPRPEGGSKRGKTWPAESYGIRRFGGFLKLLGDTT